MIAARVYLVLLLELRRAVREAATENQLRTRWHRYLFVRANCLAAYPTLHLFYGIR